MNNKTFYSMGAEAVVSELGSSVEHGLSKNEVLKRQKEFGPNQLNQAKQISSVVLFFNQFKDILILVLLVAAFVSLGLHYFGNHTTVLVDDKKTEYYQQNCVISDGRINGTVATLPQSDPYCESQTGEFIDQAEDPEVEAESSPTEALLIFAIVIAIAVVGFFNEYKAEKTVEALRQLIGQKARVRRAGKNIEIDADQLVPGDIVLLDEGAKIPADIRLVEIRQLKINEASLTGESSSVNKQTNIVDGTVSIGDQINMAFSGTFVVSGTAIGVVVATAHNTELGKIADLVNNIEQELTPMQKKLDGLGKQIGIGVLSICAVVFVAIFFLDKEIAEIAVSARIIFAFTAAVALAVAAIPEGLAFVVRISLALGARRMAAKKALVRKLSAVEALGSTDVICSDKTGTLTKGEMTVRSIWQANDVYDVSGSGYSIKGEVTRDGQKTTNADVAQMLLIGALCNNAELKLHDKILGDPTEAALLVSAAKHGIKANLKRIDEVPFSSDRKLMSTVHRDVKGYVVASKGAPEMVLAVCTHYLEKGKKIALTNAKRAEIAQANTKLASEALRVLGFAYKQTTGRPKTDDVEEGLIFLGLQGMMDPPRQEVVEVVRRVQAEAGMRVVMITGDFIETAKAIASEIGIIGKAMSGTDLDKLSDKQFNKEIESVSVYARVNPEHKIRIVQALKKRGHQVAMTGDGVNDAPAIKAADIGIAMGITGTDAAKEAADMILLDDQFLTIIKAIEEGRGIFDNVRKFVNNLLSANMAEVITILMGVVIYQDLLLTAAQLLFINIVTDGLPSIALGSDPAEAGIMRYKPNHFQGEILNKRIWAEIGIFGVLMSVALIWLYETVQTTNQTEAVSVVFIGMIIFEMVRLVDIRTDYDIPWFSNPWLSVSIAGSILLALFVMYIPPVAAIFGLVPISGIAWLQISGLSVGLFVIMKLLNPLLDKWSPEVHSPN
jgi:Ca2+-transporting ATPase